MCCHIKDVFSNIYLYFKCLFETAAMRVKPEKTDIECDDQHRLISKMER